MMLVFCATNHYVWLFYEYCSFIMHYWKKINILCELVTSKPQWFAGSQLDISKFSIANNFLVYTPICMKFAPNSLVLEILSFWLGFTVSDPFPLTIIKFQKRQARKGNCLVDRYTVNSFIFVSYLFLQLLLPSVWLFDGGAGVGREDKGKGERRGEREARKPGRKEMGEGEGNKRARERMVKQITPVPTLLFLCTR